MLVVTKKCDDQEFISNIIDLPWGGKYTSTYRIGMRKMLNLSGERTLIAAIISPGVCHIDGIYSMTFKKTISVMAGAMASLPFDFYLKVTGKSNGCYNVFSAFPVLDNTKFAADISSRALLLNCLTIDYGDLWSQEWREEYRNMSWGREDIRLSNETFSRLSDVWNDKYPLRTDYERREALVEIDVLVAMAIGMTLEQLKTAYSIQFPVLQSYEDDTWYDANGRIVFTNNRSMVGVGVSRSEFESIKDMKTGSYTQMITDDTLPDGPIERTIEYIAPFNKCDRIKDYEEIWREFNKRFSE